jgi:RNA polymerase sigma-70 factor (ECF subfamily)
MEEPIKYFIDLFSILNLIMTNSEKFLFEKLRKGDEAAFKLIYIKYVPRLYYFVKEYVSQHDIVENIVQESLLALWEKKATLADDTNLAGYLFTVAKNNCLYKLRDLRYRKNLFDTSELGSLELKANFDALVSLDTSSFTFQEIERIIEHTLEQLPAQCRLAFQLSRFEDKKYKEIAEEMNISVKAVEGHISKALRMFRVNLKDYLPLMAFLLIR